MKSKRISSNTIIFLASQIGLWACVIPLLVISHYNFPSTDDFAYGELVRGFADGQYGFIRLVTLAIKSTIHTWKTWQGRYIDVFLCYMNIGVAKPRLYCLTTYLTILPYVFSSLLFWSLIIRRAFKTDTKVALTAVSVLLIPVFLFMVSPGEGFYWFAGSISYTLAYGLSLFFGALLIAMNGAKRRALLGTVGFVLAFVVAGFNYGTILITLECLILLNAFCLIKHMGKIRYYYLSVSVFYFACFLLSTLAPGNRTRFDISEQMGAFESIISSYKYSLLFIRQWTHIPIVICIIYAVLLLAPSVVKRAKDGIRFAYPGVFTFLTVSVYSSILTPTLYSTSNYGPTRLLNLQYFMMYPLIVANVLYWTGWVASGRKKVSEKRFEDLAYKPVIVIAFVACFGLSILHWGIWNTWSTSAISSLRNGEASRYRTEQYERLSVLEDQTVSDPIFEPFTSKPRIFFGEELTSDPEFFSNRLCASYYGKNSVRVET